MVKIHALPLCVYSDHSTCVLSSNLGPNIAVPTELSRTRYIVLKLKKLTFGFQSYHFFYNDVFWDKSPKIFFQPFLNSFGVKAKQELLSEV